MKLTRGGEYGILGVLYLAQQDDKNVSVLSTIAKAQDVSPLFLAKVFQALAKAGVVKSHRGVKGGFSLGRAASQITIKEVIEAIEGPIELNRDNVPAVRAVWDEVHEKMTDVLSQANFADLSKTDRKIAITRAHSSQISGRMDGKGCGATPSRPDLLSGKG
jgi:Rrf2 family protein